MTRVYSADEIAKLCAIESHYWSEVDTESDVALTWLAMGALGAASNICAGVAQQMSPEEFQKWVDERKNAALKNS